VVSPEALADAAGRLRSGEVVAIPTDTVYGLAAATSHASAIAQIFTLKARPERVALPVLVRNLDQARALGVVDERLERLAERFWPGALTVVIGRQAGLDLRLGGDEETIGLRCPDAPEVQQLAAMVGALAVTSANRHGDEPCRSPDEVRAIFGDEVAILDGGTRDAPVSTVVSLVGDEVVILRHGAIDDEEITSVLR
jgi:L-threonylcarbamoyladenylate synthase